MTQMYQQPYQPQQPQPGKGLAITSMVLGIVSVVLFWIPYVDILTLLLGITALILGIVAGKKGKNGMATAGSGDVLSGIIGALLALSLTCFDAACLGAFIHGKAGDKAAEKIGKPSLMASDIANAISEVLRKI